MKCTKPSYRCLHLRRNTLEKHYLLLHKDFDRSKKLSQFMFNGQNFLFLANTLKLTVNQMAKQTMNCRSHRSHSRVDSCEVRCIRGST
jgi:hypothetical protein